MPPAPGPPHPIEPPSFITVNARPSEVVLGQTVCIYGSLMDSLEIGLPGRGISIAMTPPSGNPEVFTTETDFRGDYVFFYRTGAAGQGWQAVASWPGDGKYLGASAEPPAVFNVLPADTQLSIIPSAFAVQVSSEMHTFGRLTTSTPLPPGSGVLKGQPVNLYLTDPTGKVLGPLSTSTDENGGHLYDLTLSRVGVWKLWTKFNGSPDLNPSSSREIYIQVKATAGYAVIVSGGENQDGGLESRNRTTDTVYRKLRQRGFGPEGIFYLRFGVPDDNGILVEGPPSKDAIKYAITTWAKERMTAAPGPLFLIFVGPGKPFRFYVSGETETIVPWELDAWIETLERSLTGSPADGQPIAFIYGAPYSGSFIHWLSKKENPRVIITSSDPRELPVTGPLENGVSRQGEFFVLALFEQLARGQQLMRSFEQAAETTWLYTRNLDGNGLTGGLDYPDLSAHHPLLDDNGDGIGSFDFLSARLNDDGFLSSRIFLGYGEPQLEAEIVEVSPKQVISPGGYPDLWARVNNRDLAQGVWMIIKPPSFSMGVLTGDPTMHRDVDGIRVLLYDSDMDGVFSTTQYPEFTESGTYRVLFFVKDRYTGQLGEVWKSKVVVFAPAAPGPGDFSILSPKDGSAVGRQALLTWSASQKGGPDDEITYVVQIATDPSFTNVVFEQSDVEGTSFLLEEGMGLLDKTTYYWRVRAENFFGKVLFARSPEMKSTDIGQPLEGQTFYDAGADAYTVLGNGLDSFGTEDHFRFVHTSARSSFEISARVDSLNGMDGPAFAGIMIRQSTDADSPYAMAVLNADSQLVAAFRGAPGAPALREGYGTGSVPAYLKLACVRTAATSSAEITPSFSSDGKTWQPGQPMNLLLPEEVQVGICVSSGDPKNLVKAVVSQFTLSPLLGSETEPTGKSPSYESSLSTAIPPVKALSSGYGTFQTNFGAGLPGYNVLTVLVYNQNDPSQSPPGTTITITPIVGTIHNWMYSGYVPVGSYTIDVSAPSFASENRTTQVTSESPATEVFTLVPNSGSVFGRVVRASDSSNLRGAAVELEVTSGIYIGTRYNATTGTDGRFSVTGLPSAINYRITVSKDFYNTYQASFSLGAGEAKDLGTFSLGFTDSDADGLPDPFEETIVDFDPGDDIDSIGDVRGGDDFDGDGQSNRNEWIAGTDATASTSCLRIVSIVGNSSDSFTITWTSVGGMLYKVYYGATVGSWSLASWGIAASGTGQNSWTDDDMSGTSPWPGETDVRCYRVEAY